MTSPRTQGVSLGTASRVLSGHPATSPQARDRVTEAVTALGYRPNVQARSLRLTRTQAIGLLVSDVRNPFFADVAHAAEQAALAADYVTLLGNANENVEQQDRYLETFLNQRVDGVVLAPQGRGSGSLDALIASQMPVVFVDRTVDGFDVPSVTTDSRAASTRRSLTSSPPDIHGSAISAAPSRSRLDGSATTTSSMRSRGTASTSTRR